MVDHSDQNHLYTRNFDFIIEVIIESRYFDYYIFIKFPLKIKGKIVVVGFGDWEYNNFEL